VSKKCKRATQPTHQRPPTNQRTEKNTKAITSVAVAQPFISSNNFQKHKKLTSLKAILRSFVF